MRSGYSIQLISIINDHQRSIVEPFWRIFRHMVARTSGKWVSGCTRAQSVICRVLLSKGSEHFGSESDRHSQHLMANPVENDQLLSNNSRTPYRRTLPSCTKMQRTIRDTPRINLYILEGNLEGKRRSKQNVLPPHPNYVSMLHVSLCTRNIEGCVRQSLPGGYTQGYPGIS